MPPPRPCLITRALRPPRAPQDMAAALAAPQLGALLAGEELQALRRDLLAAAAAAAREARGGSGSRQPELLAQVRGQLLARVLAAA